MSTARSISSRAAQRLSSEKLDRRTLTRQAELPLTQLLSFSLAADGKRMAVAGWDRARREYVLGLWDLTTQRAVKWLAGHRDPTNRFSMPILAAALSPDGRVLVSADGRGHIRLWDIDTGKERRAMEGHRGAVTSLRFLLNSSRPERKWLCIYGDS